MQYGTHFSVRFLSQRWTLSDGVWSGEVREVRDARESERLFELA